MSEQLKRFKITLEFELTVTAIDTSVDNANFSNFRNPDEAQGYFPQHIGRQAALQKALLADPDLLDRLIRCEAADMLSGGNEDYDTLLNAEDSLDDLERQLVEQTEEPYRTELIEIMDSHLFPENTEEFSNSIQLKGIRGTIEELPI